MDLVMAGLADAVRRQFETTDAGRIACAALTPEQLERLIRNIAGNGVYVFEDLLASE